MNEAQAERAFRGSAPRAARHAAAWWLATCGSLIASEAHASSTAQGILHKVVHWGETYDQLADYYYGSRYLAHHLSATNRYQEPLKPGVTLIIPTYRRVALDGLPLASFARRHLSRASRAPYLERLHGLNGTPDPTVRLIVPPVLRHRVRPGETLGAIARTYYRDASPRRQELIRLYNELQSSQLRARSVLRIPLDTPTFAHDRVLSRSRQRLKLKPDRPTSGATAKLASASAPVPRPFRAERARNSKTGSANAPGAPAKTTTRPKPIAGASPARKGGPQKARAPLRPEADTPRPDRVPWTNRVEAVERQYTDGHYRRCLTQATRTLFIAKQAPRRHRIQLLSLAASCLVALDRPKEATARLRELLTLDPRYEPDAYRTSPKILDVFKAARRGLQGRTDDR